MQVKETTTEGLSRTYEVVIAKTDLAERLDKRITEIQPQVRLKGFRPGKVPASHIRKMFGRSMMDEIIQDVVKTSSEEVLAKNELRAAAFPDIRPTSEIDAVAAGDADLSYELRVELMPQFTPIEPKSISLERPVSKPSDEDIDNTLANIAKENTSYVERRKGSKAKEGDELLIDFVGTIDGVAFEGGTGEDAPLVIGAGRFIPGFEEQLEGAKVGDEVDVKVTFPADYDRADLRAQDAVFKVTVKEVRAPEESQIDDALAQKIGFESLDALKEAITARLQADFSMQSRMRVKRRLLDAIDVAHDFELPSRMVEQEFAQIWQQVSQDIQAGNMPDEDKDKPEAELKAEYEGIARRRVRLGLVLAEIGRANRIEVTEEELARAIAAEARRHRGQESQVVKFFQENANARAQLRAPIYEEKVVDFILELATVKDVEVDRESLFADEDDEVPAKPAQKTAAKKAPAKKPAGKKADGDGKKTAKSADEKASADAGSGEAPAKKAPAKKAADAKPVAAKKPAAKKTAAKTAAKKKTDSSEEG